MRHEYPECPKSDRYDSYRDINNAYALGMYVLVCSELTLKRQLQHNEVDKLPAAERGDNRRSEG